MSTRTSRILMLARQPNSSLHLKSTPSLLRLKRKCTIQQKEQTGFQERLLEESGSVSQTGSLQQLTPDTQDEHYEDSLVSSTTSCSNKVKSSKKKRRNFTENETAQTNLADSSTASLCSNDGDQDYIPSVIGSSYSDSTTPSDDCVEGQNLPLVKSSELVTRPNNDSGQTRNLNVHLVKRKEGPVLKAEGVDDFTVQLGAADSSINTDKSESDNDSDQGGIHLHAALKKDEKRIRNKRHSYYFCHETFVNIGRHLVNRHVNELEVAKLAALDVRSKTRKEGFSRLVRVGDFYHNLDVISKKQGDLILVRRPSEMEVKFKSYNDYGPCPNCLGFMLKKHLWLHIKHHCHSEEYHNAQRHIIAESNAILNEAFGSEFSQEFITSVVSVLRDDEIGKVCSEDNLILKFGAYQFETYGVTQSFLIRQSMRQLGRLLLKLRDISNSKDSLIKFISPKMFDLVVRATKSLCLVKSTLTERPEFEIPSLALKIGYSLKKCAAILRGSAIKNENLNLDKSLENFLYLMKVEWKVRISSNALSTLVKRKYNMAELLPLTSDLIKLNDYIDSEISVLIQEVSQSCTQKNWYRLATFVLARIILFNKRRSGEAARMTMLQYLSRPNWSEQNTEELKNTLTAVEQKLAETMSVVDVTGKRFRRVPIILTSQAKKAIDLLNVNRKMVDTSPDNPYVFAASKSSLQSLRGHDCLKKIISEVELQHPDRINGTKLRKYIATVTQVFNLTENETDWLAKHLGHDVRIHRNFYRLQENAVELTKVSRLLLAIDKGETAKFAGKELKDINLEDLPTLEEDPCEVDEEIDNDNELECFTQAATCIPEDSDFEVETSKSSSHSNKSFQRSGKSNKQTCVKKPWSVREKDAVYKYFKTEIKNGIVPAKEKCDDCIRKHENVLSNRKWTDVKFCVKNQITKINKIKKK